MAMNPVISAQLREFASSNSLSSHSEDIQFEIYSIFAIMNGQIGENIDAYDVHLKGTEFGLDGVAIVVQGEIVRDRKEAEEKISSIKNPSIEFVFFQSKTSTSFDYGEISKFFDGVAGFFVGELGGESDALDDLIDAMRAIYEKGVSKRNPKISCYYIATGNYDASIRIERLRSAFRARLEGMNIFDSRSIQIEMIGARELQRFYRAATTAVEVEIEFPRNVVMPSNDHVDEAYIGYIDALNLLKLFVWEHDEGQLYINRAVFFDNIRDYDPGSKINMTIKDAVSKYGGGDFVFRNNGITVVSKSIDRTGDRFRLEDYQIVNGCQTSNVIYDLVYGVDAEAPHSELLKESLQVPFRLIGSKDDDFVSSIIVGTNKQNPVREEQFWALRPFMKSLEEYCRNLDSDELIFFERRDNQYRNMQIERTRIMQPSVLMKAVAACLLFQPQRAARDYRGILQEYEGIIFLDDHDVRIYHAVAFLYYRLEFLWRNQRIDSEHKTFRYYILAGIGLRLTDGKNVFSLRRNKLVEAATKLVRICKDEEALKGEIVSIINVVDDRLKELGVTTQERIRDTIRSETFSSVFKERILASS